MSYSGKSKQDKHCPSEINSARSKLDGVLQTLVTKSEDSPDVSENDSIKTSPEISSMDMSSSVTNVKKPLVGKPPRKRRRKDDTNNSDQNNYHQTYIMKLFERSVDLAQFSEDTPLYPICRAWMYNQPQKRIAPKSRSPSPEVDLGQTHLGLDDNQEDIKSNDVYYVPRPLSPVKNENGEKKDLRIPSPIPPSQNFCEILTDSENAPSRETLIADHLVRWKAIRQKWKESALLNEARSKESLAIIKSLFVR